MSPLKSDPSAAEPSDAELAVCLAALASLARITGRTVAEECRHPSLDLVAWLQARQLRWVGQVLRADPARLDRQALLSRAAALRGQAGKGYPDGFKKGE